MCSPRTFLNNLLVGWCSETHEKRALLLQQTCRFVTFIYLPAMMEEDILFSPVMMEDIGGNDAHANIALPTPHEDVIMCEDDPKQNMTHYSLSRELSGYE